MKRGSPAKTDPIKREGPGTVQKKNLRDQNKEGTLRKINRIRKGKKRYCVQCPERMVPGMQDERQKKGGTRTEMRGGIEELSVSPGKKRNVYN